MIRTTARMRRSQTLPATSPSTSMGSPTALISPLTSAAFPHSQKFIKLPHLFALGCVSVFSLPCNMSPTLCIATLCMVPKSTRLGNYLTVWLKAATLTVLLCFQTNSSSVFTASDLVIQPSAFRSPQLWVNCFTSSWSSSNPTGITLLAETHTHNHKNTNVHRDSDGVTVTVINLHSLGISSFPVCVQRAVSVVLSSKEIFALSDSW